MGTVTDMQMYLDKKEAELQNLLTQKSLQTLNDWLKKHPFNKPEPPEVA